MNFRSRSKEHLLLFFVWFDDNPKKLLLEKVQEAVGAYIQRFKLQPTLILVNPVDIIELANFTIRAENTVQPNTFWLGFQEQSGCNG